MHVQFVSFDTFKFIARLEKAGVSRAHAMAISEAQSDALKEVMSSGVATKEDVQSLKMETAVLRAELSGKIDKLTWMFGALVVMAAGAFVKQFIA